ncbi:MAG: HD domain-containing protein [Lachnospiraceae bacterium]|nr:HD domain-containing protein [Lachnospiraceae bacterium]
MERDYITDLNDLLLCITKAINLINPEINDHHSQVAYLAYNIAKKLNVSVDDMRTLIIASMLHDVGAIAYGDTIEVTPDGTGREHKHAFVGAKLLQNFNMFDKVSEIVKYHHMPWNHGEGKTYNGQEVPYLSHIIHLADSIVLHLNKYEPAISQVKDVKKFVVKEKGSTFNEEIVDAFLAISDREAMWLYLQFEPQILNEIMDDSISSIKLSINDAIELTEIFAHIIDFRSPFTSMHSAGVAATAVALAKKAGFSSDECKMVKIAGNLHDIGKLKTPKEILEKQGKLEEDEFNIIKEHSFYTYLLLKPVSGFEQITEWAAFHHEKMNGTGYPFHFPAKKLSLGSRILAVADIFTAITEDRPYRAGMDKETATEVIKEKVKEGAISPYVSSLLLYNFDDIYAVSKKAAAKAVEEYSSFLNDVG